MDDDSLKKIGKELQALDDKSLAGVLLQFCLELTILARAYFLESAFDRAKDCNETIHRILGFIGPGRVSLSPTAARLSMINMVVTGANQKGWTNILQRAIKLIVIEGKTKDEDSSG